MIRRAAQNASIDKRLSCKNQAEPDEPLRACETLFVTRAEKMGAGASASVEGGRTVSDELFGKLDEAKAGVLTLVELDAAVKKLSASDEQVASMAQKKWSMFGDGWDLDADEDDASKTVDADGFYAIVTRVYPHLAAAPAAAAAEPAEDEAATKLQCAMRTKQAKATVELKRSASATTTAAVASCQAAEEHPLVAAVRQELAHAAQDSIGCSAPSGWPLAQFALSEAPSMQFDFDTGRILRTV